MKSVTFFKGAEPEFRMLTERVATLGPSAAVKANGLEVIVMVKGQLAGAPSSPCQTPLRRPTRARSAAFTVGTVW
jgi:hypothetical protein